MIIEHKDHQGVLRNFQNCFDSCSGDVIFSCDQDDVWENNKIERYIPFFQEGCVFVYADAIIIDEEGKKIQESFWTCYGQDLTRLTVKQFQMMELGSNCIAGCGMAFTKALWQKAKPIPWHVLHDHWIALCAPAFGKMAFIKEPMMRYRRHGANVSSFDGDRQVLVESETEITKKKHRLIPAMYYSTMPDQWFGNPHYYWVNILFDKQMGAFLEKDYAKLVKRSIEFREILLTCLPKVRVRSVMRLSIQFLKGNYRLFRGNFKWFLRDIAFLCVNQHTTFEHDWNAW